MFGKPDDGTALALMLTDPDGIAIVLGHLREWHGGWCGQEEGPLTIIRQDPRAWQEGFQAALEDVPTEDCPYPAGDILALAWSSGFIEGRAEAEQHKLRCQSGDSRIPGRV